jgi:hypothetical protein
VQAIAASNFRPPPGIYERFLLYKNGKEMILRRSIPRGEETIFGNQTNLQQFHLYGTQAFG